MLNKSKLFTLFMLMTLIFSTTTAFATSEPATSGEPSGDISSPTTPTNPSSGDISGEIPGDVSGEVSGEVSGDVSGEVYLASVALSSSISTYQNTTVTSTLRATLVSGEQNIRYIIDTQPTHGTLLFENNTVPTFSYTPDKDYIGTDAFSFHLTNGTLISNSAMVTITITEKNTEPVIPFYYIDMQDHWANYSASHLAARHLIVGEEIGKRYYFKPNTLTTRQDFMLYLLAITESNEDANANTATVTFADESLYPTWLLEAAKLAYAKGIIKGSLQNNKLYLNLYHQITRSEAAVMIQNVLKPSSTTEPLPYLDTKDIPTWATQAVQSLTAYKILQGDGEYLRPNSIITKAEAAELCYKLLKQLETDTWNQSISGDSSGDLK